MAEITVELPATADTYLRGLATDTNEGASSLLSVRKIGTHRLLVRFDGIGEVIGEGTLLSATLRLSVVLNGNDWGLSGRPLDLHRLLVPWSEGNGWTADNPNPTRGTGRGATWNCPDDADIANFTPDCTVPWQWESPASASMTITNDTEGSVSWDVTADVAAFLQGTPNFGWLLEKGDEAQTGLIRFASREHGGTPPPTLVITYAPPANRPPEPSAAPIVTQEDTEGTTQVFANDPDPGQTHLFAVTLPPAHGTVTIDSGGNVIYAPSLDFNGSDLFEVTVTDDATPPLSGVVAIPVTIEPVNDAPRARAPGHLVTQEDTPLSFTIEVEDPDVGQSHLFTLQMPPLDGEVSVDSAGNVTYTPNPGFFGVDGFGIEVRDDDPSPLSEVVTTSVTVVERNDPPQPQAAPIVTQEDTPATSQLFANDPNSEQAHTYTISSPPLHGTASIDPSGLVTYDPASDFTGSDEIGVRVTDDGTPPLSGSVTIPVTVSPENDPPRASAPAIVTREGMPGSTRIVVEDPDAGQTHTYEVTTQPLGGNAAVDPSGNVTYTPNSGFTGSDLFEVTVTDDGAPPLSVTVAIEATVLLNVVITDPADATVTQAATVTVAGTVSTSADLVEVNGIAATLGGGTFQATVPLEEGTNLLVAVARAPSGATGNAVVRLMRDTSPPRLSIEFPPADFVADRPTITLSGLVNDLAVGTINAEDVTLSCNAVDAEVSNRAFHLPLFELRPGPNLIVCTATDGMGNSRSATRVVTRRRRVGQRIEILSGDGQRGEAGGRLPDPLVVRLLDAQGHPVMGRRVDFAVVRGGGLLDTGGEGKRRIAVETDEAGEAALSFTLGRRSGAGIHRVRATAVGFGGEAFFHATAMAGAPDRIVAVSGGNQRGIVATPLSEPLSVLVVDSFGNPVRDVPVTFRVTRGGGNFDGNETILVTTNDDGRAEAFLTLGGEGGIRNNTVMADFPGLAGSPAFFALSGVLPGDPADTRITGVVLDNANVPIPDATVSVEGTTRTAVTDGEGRFLLSGVPVGFLHLVIDASTTTRAETFPKLIFPLIAIAGVENTIGMPAFFPPLSGTWQEVGGSGEVTLSMPGIPELTVTVAPNSTSFPDGSSVGLLSVSQVNLEKVPMPPPNASLFVPAGTIQPPGVRFDPPARLSFPNTRALAPGEQAEVFSFDHDIGAFVSVGTATVSEDGAQLTSDPGFGIVKSGWFGVPTPPPPPTCANGCDDGNPCTDDRCENGSCVHDNKTDPYTPPVGEILCRQSPQNEVGLGKLISCAMDGEDKDCKNGQEVSDQIKDLADWIVQGVVNETAISSQGIEWESTAEGSVTIKVTFDDLGIEVKDSGPFTTSIQLTIIKPTGEITEKTGIWGQFPGQTVNAPPTIYNWKQRLMTFDIDFEGIKVKESQPYPSTVSCDYPGSRYWTKKPGLNNSEWVIGHRNYWKYDQIGWVDLYRIRFYRNNDANDDNYSLPCIAEIPQTMNVVLKNGVLIEYKTHTIQATVESQT